MKFIRFLIVAAVGVAIAASVAAAQESRLPDAASVAIRVNQRVTFQDIVKAVSRSRTRDGFYVSFGEPFPKQTLSVWVTDKIGRGLPGLLGRTVRVDGVVQSSQTGPMINLESIDQIQVLPIDESILSKLPLAGRTDRRQFTTAIRQHLKRREFDTIEVLGNELHQSRERFTDGTWILDAFLSALELGDNASTKVYEERMQAIAAWKTRYPTSILAILAEARCHIDLAWKFRLVPRSGEPGKQSRTEMAEARKLLENNPQVKASPGYFVEMQSVALGQGWKREDYFRLFDEAVSHEPEFYRFYFAAALYLHPRWYGAKGEWEQFAQQQRERLGGPTGDALYARIAWSLAEIHYRHLFEETSISWSTMAAGFDVILQQYPASTWNRNAYACFAWQAKDRARLRPALEAIKSNPDMEIWVNLENFQFAEKFANSQPDQ